MAAPQVASSVEFVSNAYKKIDENIKIVRRRLNRPLTYAEKVLLGHLTDPENANLVPGESFIDLKPDRVALQDVTGQMTILQFMQANRPNAAVPTTVHCDHLIQAFAGAEADTGEAVIQNKEVYDFLRSAANKYGLGFWGPGSGIIHQVVLENYAFPGGMMIGTDSHTPNAGGLGMFAAGVGGADAVDVMAGFSWEVLYPKLIGVKLTGTLSGWTAPKDVILKLAGILTVKGGTNAIVEYFGPGTNSISATGKATITNMGAELGATTSIFPYDERSAIYLDATNRGELSSLANEYQHLLKADDDVVLNPENYFDRIVEINLDELEPHVVGPHTPDLARPISEMEAAVNHEAYPDSLSAALIGSCTNSSYEDIARVADLARQAAAHGAKIKVPLMISPGSEAVHATIKRDGQMADLEAIGATVLANACGPCIGQWKRPNIEAGHPNSIVSSFNRNFPARNDGNAGTNNFITSPEIVLAYALSGQLSFNPLTDSIETNGETWKLEAPSQAPEVPNQGYEGRNYGYEPPSIDGSDVVVEVDPTSNRLEILQPFAAWDGTDFQDLRLLLKAKGKCTTDHISPAGPWLRFRGHLSNLSDNAFLGAVNAFTDIPGKGLNSVTGENGLPFPQIAQDYRARGLSWIVVGDENYGEGSSREHAAMSPRLLGAKAVIVRSFARIHESNLKKQGILPLTFSDANDYDKILETDKISILGIADLKPGVPLKAVLAHENGVEEQISLTHTMSEEHIAWFKAGAALNILGQSN